MNSVQIYQELAVAHDQQGQAQVRDRFLVLAADAALSAGRVEEAEALRGRLLQMNPHHLLKPFGSLGQALESPDVKTYVEGLRRTYPPAEAELALQKLRKEQPATSSARSATPVVLPRTGPSSPEWEEAKRQPGTASEPAPARTAPTVVAPAPAPRPVPTAAAAPSPPPARLAPASPPPPPPPARLAPASPPPPPPPARPAPAAAAHPPAPMPLEEPIPFVPEPVRSTRVYPVVEAAVPSMSNEPEGDADESPGPGAWLVSALFYVVLLGALGLGAYTLVRPFL